MGFFGIGPVHRENWRDHIYGRGPAVYIIMLIVLALIVLYATRAPLKTTVYVPSPRESAWNACTAAVEKDLGLSPSDAEEYSPVAVTLLAENRYQVEVRYPGQNARHTCTVEKTPDGEWQVLAREAK